MSCLSQWARQNFPALLKTEHTLSHRQESADPNQDSDQGKLTLKFATDLQVFPAGSFCPDVGFYPYGINPNTRRGNPPMQWPTALDSKARKLTSRSQKYLNDGKFFILFPVLKFIAVLKKLPLPWPMLLPTNVTATA